MLAFANAAASMSAAAPVAVFASPSVDVVQDVNGRGQGTVAKEAGSSTVMIEARSAAELNERLARWLVQSFQEAGLAVQVTPQGSWGMTAPWGQPLHAVLASKVQSDGVWQVEIRLDTKGNGQPGQAVARFQARELRPAWALTRSVRRGEAVACEALMKAWRPVGKGKDNWQGDCRELSGLTARRALMPGDVLKSDDLADDIAVKMHGETVVVTRIGAIEVRAKGMALADAQVGTKVPIRLNGQSQVVYALVVGPGVTQMLEGM